MRIITAIGNKYLNSYLSKKIEVVSNDILYQDGVLEALDEIEDIGKILLSTEIYGEYEFNDFIEKIISKKENIEIIVFSKRKDFLDINFLNSKNIYKIYENNESGYKLYIKSINSFKDINEEEIKNEINLFKEEIKEGKNKIKFVKNYTCKNIIKENYLKSTIIAVLGPSGVGKSLFSVIYSRYLEEIDKKVLLIDFDIDNPSLKIILGKNKKEMNAINISKNLSFLSISDILDVEIEYFSCMETLKYIESIKNNYDFVIIDFPTINEKSYMKSLLNSLDTIIFLIEPNLIGIKKAKLALDIYLKDWNISESKINIVFNKFNKYSIDKNILKEIFCDYKILEDIKYEEEYDLYVDKNTKFMINKEKYEKIYQKLK